MPGIKISKENFEQKKKLTPGIYPMRFDGFEQQYAKSGESINLRPVLIIVNNADYKDRRVLEWLNTLGHRAIIDFHHCFGQQVPEEFEEIPFNNIDDPKIENWKYAGELTGRIGQVELAENASDGKVYINVKRYLCAFPGCKLKHSENLLR